MAKGKYEYWLTEEGLTLIEGWARDGLREEDIAHNMGIRRQTLIEWKKRFTDISDSLKKGREVCDRIVENALFKKATGYSVMVNKAFKIKDTQYDPVTGKKMAEIEKIITAPEEVFVPADTTAQIFWLKNRKPKVWMDRPVDVEETEGSGVIVLAEAMDGEA